MAVKSGKAFTHHCNTQSVTFEKNLRAIKQLNNTIVDIYGKNVLKKRRKHITSLLKLLAVKLQTSSPLLKNYLFLKCSKKRFAIWYFKLEFLSTIIIQLKP